MPEELEKLKNALKEKYEALKEDLHIDHAEGAEETFLLPNGQEGQANAAAAMLLEKMLSALTMTSPVDSVVTEVTENVDTLEIAMADSFALIVKMPEALLKTFKVQVQRGENVQKGSPLAEFTEEQLEHSAFFITAGVKVMGAEMEEQTVIRVFGPFIPVPEK